MSTPARSSKRRWPLPVRRPLSLRLRLLSAAALVLLLFLSVTGVTLDRAFQRSVEGSAREQLHLRVLALLGAAEVGESRLRLPSLLPEPRFNQPGSGLYAWVLDAGGAPLWTSQSLVGSAITAPDQSLAPGRSRFVALRDAEGDRFYRYALGVVWEAPAGDRRYTFAVATAQAPFRAETQGFRRALFTGLGGAGVALMLVLVAVMSLSMRPLRQLAREVGRVERGESERLGDDWPEELSGLARNLNLLVDHERARQQRYRNTLDDLTHSLKTPLAIVRNALAETSGQAPLVGEQIERMQAIINHHLQRASLGQHPLHVQRTALLPPLTRTVSGLQRLHADKTLHLNHELEAGAQVAVDERDLYEMLGNLIENACKFSHRQVQVLAWPETGAMMLSIADDGPGVPRSLRRAVLGRGARADTRTAGQGLGLALVSELVQDWGGELSITESSALGGAEVRLRLPAAPGAQSSRSD